MAIGKIAALALGLALPLTFVGAAAADYSDDQIEILSEVLPGSEDGTYSVWLPIAGGVYAIEDGSRAGSGLYDTVSDFIIYGPSED